VPALSGVEGCYASAMQPNLAQVLNTLAHEIRTPLAVSQGYLKLYLDGRLTNPDDTRRAFEQTRQALGALATMCVDMGKVSALSEREARGVPQRLTADDFIARLRAAGEMASAAWPARGIATTGAIDTSSPADLLQAVATVSKAAFDEARDATPEVRIDAGKDLIVLAGAASALTALQDGPDASQARPVDFGKGGKGLKLILAAFVLDTHHVQTWTLA
jgi:signal transduction histidine kinase